MQVKEDVYEKMDKELLAYVEDVLLNRCDNATERLLSFAATIEPKSKPCAVRKIGAEMEADIPAKVYHCCNRTAAHTAVGVSSSMCPGPRPCQTWTPLASVPMVDAAVHLQ